MLSRLLLALLAILAAPVAAATWPHARQVHAQDVPASFDCAMRKLAYAYGKKLVPRQGVFESLYYALDLNAENCSVPLAQTQSLDLDAAVSGSQVVAGTRCECSIELDVTIAGVRRY